MRHNPAHAGVPHLGGDDPLFLGAGGVLPALLTSSRAERNRLVRQAHVDGRTIYALAKELGVAQNAVRRMLGL